MSNIAYLRFIEQARSELMEALGRPLRAMAATGEYPAVLRTEIDYRKPAVLGDIVRVEARLGLVRRVRFECVFTLRRDADDAVLAECRQQAAFIQVPAMRPIPVPFQEQD